MDTIVINKNGNLFDLRELINYFTAKKDGAYRVEITTIRAKRSNQQNAWLWGCIYPCLRVAMVSAGWDNITCDEDVHEFFKTTLGGKKIVNRETGEVVSIPTSTAQMNTEQFGAYCEKLRDYGQEFLGVNIPDPQR